MFGRCINCLCSHNNFAVSFGFLVKWSKLDMKLFLCKGHKIPNHYHERVICSTPSDIWSFLSAVFCLFIPVLSPVLPGHKLLLFGLHLYSFTPLTPREDNKRLLGFQRSLPPCTEYNTAPRIFISRCPACFPEGWKQMCSHVVFI